MTKELMPDADALFNRIEDGLAALKGQNNKGRLNDGWSHIQQIMEDVQALRANPAPREVTETEAINLVINSWSAGSMDNTVEYVIRRSVQELAGLRITKEK